MSFFRHIYLITAMSLAAFAIIAAAPAASAAAAQGAPGSVYIEVNPNTIQAGYQVGLRASCGENVNQATVSSRAFSDVTLRPQSGSNMMTASAMVPPDTRPGEYRADLRCANGDTASAELFVLDMARPTAGPPTGGGGTAGAAIAAPLLLGGGALALAVGVGMLLRRRPA